MPELPEVEITRRGLAGQLVGQPVAQVVVRNARLRLPVPDNLPELLCGQTIHALTRRAKYLLLRFADGTLIMHLGMSGSLRLLPEGTTPNKHDHFDLVLGSGTLMRLRDPRRFGAIVWQPKEAGIHPLLARLGPEPLEDDFDAQYLHEITRGRSVAIKQLIMDSHAVVGVGNIYASEALFRAGISPLSAAGRLEMPECMALVGAIRDTLIEAIHYGGSSLRDFVNAAGQAGHFQQHYWVYGRCDEPCRKCGALIMQIRQGQRSSFYCGNCQK